MAAAPWGLLPTPLVVSNAAPWIDSIAFKDAAGDPVNITEPLRIGLRKTDRQSGYALLLEEGEIVVSANIGTWTVIADRMKTLAAGEYDLEVTAGDGAARRVQLRGTVHIVAGIVP